MPTAVAATSAGDTIASAEFDTKSLAVIHLWKSKTLGKILEGGSRECEVH